MDQGWNAGFSKSCTEQTLIGQRNVSSQVQFIQGQIRSVLLRRRTAVWRPTRPAARQARAGAYRRILQLRRRATSRRPPPPHRRHRRCRRRRRRRPKSSTCRRPMHGTSRCCPMASRSASLRSALSRCCRSRPLRSRRPRPRIWRRTQRLWPPVPRSRRPRRAARACCFWAGRTRLGQAWYQRWAQARARKCAPQRCRR